MALHKTTFEYLKPTDAQISAMAVVRAAAAEFARVLDEMLPDGPDKTFTLRAHRSNAMWANVAITREANGAPRGGPFEGA
jgi:hypothetical protein